MQAPKEVPPNLQCKDKFLLQSVTVPNDTTTEDIVFNMFNTEGGKVVEEFKLRVAYVPVNSTSPVSEESEETTSLKANGNQRASVFDVVSRSFEEPKAALSEARATVSKLTEKKKYAPLQAQKLHQELEYFTDIVLTRPVSPRSIIPDYNFDSLMEAEENEEMKINLRVMKTIPFRVKKSDPIRKLKTSFSDLEGISTGNINGLFFAGRCLENDEKSFVDYNITDGSTVSVYLSSESRVQLYVKMSQLGKTITVDMDAKDTIFMLKQKIRDKEGISTREQDLVYLGEQLENTQTISSYNILNGSTLFVIFPAENAMEIFVDLTQSMVANTIKMKVKKWYTIENVKNMIESTVGIPTEKLELYFSKRMVGNQATLAELGIEGGETLGTLHGVRVIVRFLTGKTMTLDVDGTDTVENLKEMMEMHEGIHVDQQRLVYNSYQLVDSRTLAECNIKNDAVIHLVLLRG